MTKKTERGKAYFMISAVSQKLRHPSPDAPALRTRRAADAVAHRGQHAAVFGGGPRTARDHPLAHARARRQPRRRRDHPQHAAQDRADAARGQRVHGLREARDSRAASTTGSSASAPRWSRVRPRTWCAARHRRRRRRPRQPKNADAIRRRSRDEARARHSLQPLGSGLWLRACKARRPKPDYRHAPRRPARGATIDAVSCALCDDTGWKSIEVDGVQRVDALRLHPRFGR